MLAYQVREDGANPIRALQTMYFEDKKENDKPQVWNEVAPDWKQGDPWKDFHTMVALRMKGKQRPAAVCGVGIGGMFAAQFVAQASEIELANEPGPGALSIALTDCEEIRNISSLGYGVAWIYDAEPPVMPWDETATPTTKGPSLANILRELADYVELQGE